MGTTAGVGTLAASMLLFSTLESRPVLHEVVIAAFMVVTTPVTYLLLVRAAMHREGVRRKALDADARETRDAAPGGQP